jgi:gamma-glutamylcyclotransferase (GGCT)/AIG2-like uncharacterized protein YtfP
MGDILLGLLLGLVTSLIGWWLVTRAVAPKLDVSREISKLPDPSVAGRWRYRIKVTNLRRWLLLHQPAVEVRIVASLRVKGFDGYKYWTDFPIPIAHTGELDMIERNALPRLRLYDMNEEHLRRFVDRSAEKDIRNVGLEELLSAGEDAEVRVIVSAAHPYTGARRAVTRRYSMSDIAFGAFRARSGREGLRVVESSSRREGSMSGSEALAAQGDARIPPPSPRSALLFQYGSNMSEQRLAGAIHRFSSFAPPGTPLELRLLGSACLRGWSFAFDLYSTVQQCRVADIVEATSADAVWGALYEVDAELVTRSDNARSVLDRIEGRQTERDPENYLLTEVEVEWRGERATAFAYVGRQDARHRCKTEHPDAELCADYVAAVLDGARDIGLASDYVRSLERTIAAHRVGPPSKR